MSKKRVTPRNLSKVLKAIDEQMTGDKTSAKMFCDHFNLFLDDLDQDDFWGTEGQLDPRGDQRNP